MIEEVATVVKKESTRALVETQVKTTCGNCKRNSSCGVSSIAKAFAHRNQSFWLAVPAEQCLIEGDKVKIGIEEQHLLKVSFQVYIFPLIGLLLSVLLMTLLFPSLSEIGQLFIGLASAFFVYRYIQKQYLNGVELKKVTPIFLHKLPKLPPDPHAISVKTLS